MLSRKKTKRKATRDRVLTGVVVELLEQRQLLAAHIVGNASVFSTIQAAVDAATPGATITVDPGTYSEMVWIGKSLTLCGAQAGVDARSNLRRRERNDRQWDAQY